MRGPLLDKNDKEVTEFRLLSAFSGNHVVEAAKSCKSIGSLPETQSWKDGYMIVYILKDDVSDAELDIYRKHCPFVELRLFNSSKYPGISKDLSDYRWKPILVDEVLNGTDIVFWLDASIIFHPNANESLMDIINTMEKDFDKCGIRFVSETFHSIYSATHPSTLKRFNITTYTAKKTKMYESGWFIASRKGYDIIHKWKICALEKECMAPTGSQQPCDYAKLRQGEYGGCHRYDQTVLNILTIKCSINVTEYYKPSPLLSVERLGDFNRLTFPPQAMPV